MNGQGLRQVRFGEDELALSLVRPCKIVHRQKRVRVFAAQVGPSQFQRLLVLRNSLAQPPRNLVDRRKVAHRTERVYRYP